MILKKVKRFPGESEQDRVMKKNEQLVRNKLVPIRMNEEEFKTLEQNRKKTTEKTNSNYLRKLALRKPLTALTRNASMDDFTMELVRLRKELNHIGVNFNQAVHKLHTLERIPEFRQWIISYEQTRTQIIRSVETIFTFIGERIEKWNPP
jgi:hypothetical protein